MSRGGAQHSKNRTPAAERAQLLRDALKLVESARDPVERLVAIRKFRQVLDIVEGQAWESARAAGHSWRDLAEPLGITRSGAQQRAAALRQS